MSKILGVADIHISNYNTRNPEGDTKYRLHQGSRIVAENIINVGKSKGCDYLVIAGDTTEKALLSPLELAEVKLFLEKVASGFKAVWIIWGNHDMDCKTSTNQDITDSSLGCILPSNMYYSHQQTITIDNTVIGFSNWQPNFDLSWIKNKVDVLFTHATINYSKDGSDFFKSQVLDDSKFDIAFCGDIHKPGEIGKYVSIGIPQRCKMSDGDVLTGIVLDCENKSWERVDMNPFNNLMKFQYVSEIEKEGWDETTGTWNIFKKAVDVVDPNTGIKISEWQQIEGLVNDIISKSGLDYIHSEVLKNIQNLDACEVNFAFQLVRVSMKNWRSITDATVNFNQGDKILLVGQNGAGKSSLISAIKFAFTGTKYTKSLQTLRPFIQFGTKECCIEVEFIYQGSQYILKRGGSNSGSSGEYGLWINGEEQKYKGLKQFEADIESRFPFIGYLEVLIHDQEHNQFIGSIPGERLAEIISKCFGLDKIDMYNGTAEIMLSNIKQESSGITGKINEGLKVLEYINSRLNSVRLPGMSKMELENLKNEGLELERKSRLWTDFLTYSSQYQAAITTATQNITDLETKISGFRSQDEINNEIQSLENQTRELQQKLIGLGSIRSTISMKNSELGRIIAEGKNIRAEFDSIKPGEEYVCPTCNSIVKPDPEKTKLLENRKAELKATLDEKMKEYNSVASEIKILEEQKNNSESEFNNINNQIQLYNGKISDLKFEIKMQENTKNTLQNEKQKLETATNQLNRLGCPEKAELPSDFMQKMSELNNGISIWSQWEIDNNEKNRVETEITNLQSQMQDVVNQITALESYIKLTASTGLIYKEVMEKLTSKFNDSYVRYEVYNFESRGKQHLTLMPQFCIGSDWVSYEACSGGQKTIIDIHLLSKIINGAGLLILDEFLKHLDQTSLDLAIETISSMNVGCVMLSSHASNIIAFNNRTCELKLDNTGHTIININ